MNTKTLMEIEEKFRRQAIPSKSSRSHLLVHLRDNWEGWDPPKGDDRLPYIHSVFDEIDRVHTIENILRGTINYASKREQAQ